MPSTKSSELFTPSVTGLIPKESPKPEFGGDVNLAQVSFMILQSRKDEDLAPQILDYALKQIQSADEPHLTYRDPINMRHIHVEGAPETPVTEFDTTVFLGPKTTDPHVYGEYPRIVFHWAKKGGQWQYDGFQVGVRGILSGPRYTARQVVGGEISAHMLTGVNLTDVENQLSPFLPPVPQLTS